MKYVCFLVELQTILIYQPKYIFIDELESYRDFPESVTLTEALEPSQQLQELVKPVEKGNYMSLLYEFEIHLAKQQVVF